MKIKKIEINDSPIFINGFTLTFSNVESEQSKPTIHYLVGNNGCGKSRILNTLYSCLVPNRASGTPLDVENGRPKIFFNEDTSIEFPENSGINPQLSMQGLGINLGMVYCTNVPSVDNMGRIRAQSSLSTNIDDNIPNSLVLNIDNEVPQLIKSVLTNNENIFIGRFMKSLKHFMPNLEIILQGDELCFILDGSKIAFNKLSDGERYIIYRICQIIKDLETSGDCLILIDEPETNMNAIWQILFKKILLEVFQNKNVQIIIATHSPYIFNELDISKEECILIDKAQTSSNFKSLGIKIKGIYENPTMNLVSYMAFGIITKELHIELYTLLQKYLNEDSVKPLDKILFENYSLLRENRSKTNSNRFLCSPSLDANETKPTWIRNKIHHYLCLDRKDFNESDLKDSIDEMINVLKTIPV